MVTIIIKPPKNNSRSRRYRATGKYFAAKDRMRAEKQANKLLDRKIIRVLMGSVRVFKAILLASLRKKVDIPVRRTRRKRCKTEYGPWVRAQQKIKRCSIPLI